MRYLLSPPAIVAFVAALMALTIAIEEFVRYVQENEPGTKMYLAWQQKDEPTRFVHLFIFEDAAAQERHGQSEAVRKFEAAYRPELVGGDVVFTDYDMIAEKR